MALYTVNPGAVISQNDVNQFTNLLNGTTAGVTITNSERIRAWASGATARMGAFEGQVGSIAAGVPPFTSAVDGDWVVDGTLGLLRIFNASGVNGWTGGMSAISETVLSSPAVNVAFSSIPQGFNHLILILQIKSASTASGFLAENLNIRFNGVTTNGYNAGSLYNTNSSTVSAGFLASQSVMSLNSVWTSFPGNTPGNASSIFLIPYYSQADFGKQIFGISYASDGGGSSQVSLTAGAQSVAVAQAAITSINVFLGTGSNLVTGSYVGLYGVL